MTQRRLRKRCNSARRSKPGPAGEVFTAEAPSDMSVQSARPASVGQFQPRPVPTRQPRAAKPCATGRPVGEAFSVLIPYDSRSASPAARAATEALQAGAAEVVLSGE